MCSRSCDSIIGKEKGFPLNLRNDLAPNHMFFLFDLFIKRWHFRLVKIRLKTCLYLSHLIAEVSQRFQYCTQGTDTMYLAKLRWQSVSQFCTDKFQIKPFRSLRRCEGPRQWLKRKKSCPLPIWCLWVCLYLSLIQKTYLGAKCCAAPKWLDILLSCLTWTSDRNASSI